MKKIILSCAVIGLVGCATTTDAGNGLTRLDSIPKHCEFLYDLDSSVTTYKLTDAYDYIEKSILEREVSGDSYYIDQETVLDNTNRALFAPEHTYKFKVKVYNCNK